MKYNLIWTQSFTRSAKKFIKNHPQLKNRFKQILTDLEKDPLQPRLRLHPLRGDLKGLHAISLTYSYRITLTIKVTAREILLIDIGSHDEVYGK